MPLIRVRIDSISYYYEDHTIDECKDISSANQIYTFNNTLSNFVNFDFSNLTVLRELTLINCDINYIPSSLYKVTTLRLLSLNGNNIKTIEKDIENLKNLEELYLTSNKINIIPDEIGSLKNLSTLCVSYNEITEIPKTIGNLRNLKYLYINNNQLKSLPSEIVQCVNILYTLFFPQHRDFKIKTHILRFINRYSSSSYQSKVYNNTENVHISSIQSSFRKSLLSLMNDTIDTDSSEYSDWLDDSIKNDVNKYCQDTTQLSTLYITFFEVYKHVMNRILKSPHRTELLIRLHEEIIESKNLCFVGRVTRLVNVLSGFYDDIHIGISDNEQIENIILTCLRDADNNIISSFILKMKERGYSQEMVEHYLPYIEDYVNSP